MKAVNIFKAIIARILLKGSSYNTDMYSSSLTETDYCQSKFHSKKATKSARYKSKLRFYFARKKSSKQVWVEKRDKAGNRTKLARVGGGKAKNYKHHGGGSSQAGGRRSEDSGWGHKSEWIDKPQLNRATQYVYGEHSGIVGASSDYTYSDASSSHYACDGI